MKHRYPGTAAGRDESTLGAGEAHADAILDAALDAVLTIDHLGRVLEFNRAAESTFGYTREDVLGRELAELIVPPGFRDAYQQSLSRLQVDEGGGGEGGILGRRLEVPAMRANGDVFPAELAISRVDLPGLPVFTACIRDLSDQSQAEERLRAAEFRYRTLVEQLPFVVYVDAPDSPVSEPSYLSPQLETLLGHTPQEWLATPGLYEESIHPDDRDRVLAQKHEAYEQGRALRIEYRMLAADGRVVWVEDQSVLVQPPDGGQPFRQGFALDVTDRKLAEEAVQSAQTRYRLLVEQLPLAVYVDHVDEASSNIYTSPQIEPMLGYSPEEWRSDPLLFVRLLHPDDREEVLAAHAHTHSTREPLCLEYRLIARDGRVVWIHDEARIIDGGGTSVLQGYMLDVTERREAEDRLRRQAFHDPLTGLANRALFADRVQHALVPRERSVARAGVLFLDLDDFKGVNDTLGHIAGDTLLCDVGARLRAVADPSHTVARLGGDEFAILVESIDEPDAAGEVAERLLAALQLPFSVSGHELFVTASIGIAIGADADELLRAADVAMYRAKATGKAQYAFYEPTMDEAVLGRLQLIADLRRARVSEEFLLHYQPTVDLRTNAIVGLEALVRWRHPEHGVLLPGAFVPAAEETGLIVGIGRWVLAEACRHAVRCRRRLPEHPPTLSVNVSARQLHDPGFVDDVRDALAGSGLPPGALTLEITESVVAEARDDIVAVLVAVKELGVGLALDDFGTGYSSLSLLQDLPVDTLKVDRSFMAAVEAAEGRPALVRAIVELGRALGLTVVAEGIETAAQAAALRSLGCRLAQGFYFSPPLAEEKLEELLVASAGRAGSPAA